MTELGQNGNFPKFDRIRASKSEKNNFLIIFQNYWVQFLFVCHCPTWLLGICAKNYHLGTYPASDLIWEPLNFHLSVFNQKARSHAMALQKMLGQKKKVSKSTKIKWGHSNRAKWTVFQPTNANGGSSTGVETSFGKNLNFGQICKRTRNAAAKTSSSFLSHLKFLIMLFLCARMTRLGF